MLDTLRYVFNTIVIQENIIELNLYYLDHDKDLKELPSLKYQGNFNDDKIIQSIIESGYKITDYNFKFYYREGLLDTIGLTPDRMSFSFAKIVIIQSTNLYCSMRLNETTKSIEVKIKTKYQDLKKSLI